MDIMLLLSRQYNQQTEELGKLPLKAGLQSAEELLAAERNTVTFALTEKLAYFAGFQDSIETIFAKAEKLKVTSLND